MQSSPTLLFSSWVRSAAFNITLTDKQIETLLNIASNRDITPMGSDRRLVEKGLVTLEPKKGGAPHEIVMHLSDAGEAVCNLLNIAGYFAPSKSLHEIVKEKNPELLNT